MGLWAHGLIIHCHVYVVVVKKEAEVTLSVVPAMQGVVEEYAEATATGPTSSTNANTNSPVYVGSVPEGEFVLPNSIYWSSRCPN